MKPFNKSIVGSFKMPEEVLTPAAGELKRNEENPEEWCAVTAKGEKLVRLHPENTPYDGDGYLMHFRASFYPGG